MALGTFQGEGGRGVSAVAQRISVGPASYGFRPGLPRPMSFLGRTPALSGLFRSGRLVVGISQINAMATNVLRGSAT